MDISADLRTTLNREIIKEYQDETNKKDLDQCVKKTLKALKQRFQSLTPNIQTIDVV